PLTTNGRFQRSRKRLSSSQVWLPPERSCITSAVAFWLAFSAYGTRFAVIGMPLRRSCMVQAGEVSTCQVVHGLIGNGTRQPLRMSRGRFDLPAESTVGTST